MSEIKTPFDLIPPFAKVRGDAARAALDWGKTSAGAVGAYLFDKKPLAETFSKPYLKAKARDIAEKLVEEERKRRHAERMIEICKALKTASAPPYRMSKPDGSQAHSWADAVIANDVIYLDDKLKTYTRDEEFRAETIEHIQTAQVFIVEHDWAGAFKKAVVDQGEVRAPYAVSVFEFVINGVRLLHLTGADLTRPPMVFVKCKSGWAALIKTPKCEPYPMMVAHVRFICIALDAEVAKTEVIRAPHKLNSSRIKSGKLPLYDYHVVSLVKRSRPEPLASTGTGAKKRLHWRRGHWRHYQDHKTWIRWVLAGNPDLGFIDKHYRL